MIVNGRRFPIYGLAVRYHDACRMAGMQDGATVTYSNAFEDKTGRGGGRSGILSPGERIAVSADSTTIINVAHTGAA